MNQTRQSSVRHSHSRALQTEQAERPALICVDLDGTLIHTDMVAEALVAALRKNPLLLFVLPFWIMRGRAYFKEKIARCSQVNAALLPYNTELLEYLENRKKEGASLWLTTAAHKSHAEAVSSHCGLFENVLASDGSTNLKGKSKLLAIKDRLGDEPFLYAGDSRADLAVWRASAGAITVGAPQTITTALDNEGVAVVARFSNRRSIWTTWLKALRIHQWSKNTLIFVPMLLAHEVQVSRILTALSAFFSFSFCASTFYLLNDLLDLEVDRAHPRKRNRPLASGALSIRAGVCALVALTTAVIASACLLPSGARWLLAVYALLNLSYSVGLKQVLCLDVIVLAFLYTLRILFGGLATSITVSIWTLAFSVFIFLGLALLKRLTELKVAGDSGAGHIGRRPYVAADTSVLQGFTSAALYISVVVLALYLNSQDVLKLYAHSEPLWFVCLALTFWVSRMLILTNRGSMTDDPIVFAFRDRSSQIVAVLIVLCIVLAL